MKLPLLSVACFLALAGVARADQSFPAFLNGQGAPTGQTGTDQIAVVQGGTTKKAPPTYFNTPNTIVLQPIVGADNASAIGTALSTYSMVLLSPGYYEVCSQVEVPTHKSLQGTDGSRQGVGNLNPTYPWNYSPTVIGSNGCPNGGNGSFASSGQGYLHLHDFVNLSGFTIQGQRSVGSHFAINCINAENAMSINIDGMVLVDCYIGLDRASSSTPGDHGSLSQDAVVVNSVFTYNESDMIFCGTGSGGSGCADERYNDNEFEVPQTAIHCVGCVNIQILNNRFEDGGGGISLFDGAFAQISNNFFNRIIPLVLDGTGSGFMVSFNGNNAQGTEPGNSQNAIYLLNGYYGLTVTNNVFGAKFISIFITGTNGSMLLSSVNNNISGGIPIYDSATTASRIAHNVPFVPQSANNLDVGDSAFNASWTTTGATKAGLTAIAPTGDVIAARLTEDGTTGGHTMANTVSFPTMSSGSTYTSLVYFAPGSSGTRNAVIRITNTTNVAFAVFNPTTCALVTSGVVGAAVIVGTPSAVSIGNGWCRGAISYTGVPTAQREVSLASGSSTSYAGDSTSNLLFWSYDQLLGARPPGTWLVTQP